MIYDLDVTNAHTFRDFLNKLVEECHEASNAAAVVLRTGDHEDLLHLVEEMIDVRIIIERIERRMTDPDAEGINDIAVEGESSYIEDRLSKTSWEKVFRAMVDYKKNRQVIRDFAKVPQWGEISNDRQLKN